MSTILVTGATGFTGGHLARTLRRRGHHVRALVRDPARAAKLAAEGIELVRGDVTDPGSVARAVDGCEFVYHIAALYREARHPDDVYWRVNVDGTANVLDAAERAGVQRVIHCSTVGVHGDVKRMPADEKAPYAPGDIYQKTKLAGERIAQERFANGLPGTVVRPAGIYGPGDMRFLKLFRAIKNRTFLMIGDGETHYHLTYIDDLVEGMILCAESPQAVGQTYILAGPRHTTLNELVAATARAVGCRPPRGRIPVFPVMAAARLAERICRPLGIEPPLHERRVSFFIKNRGFCIDKARHELGYVPRVELEEGIQRTAQWYRANGLL
ncbi:MAG: NAD-dependent epimerase/dehydratase family protein [Pseudomonadota bacterium]